MLAVTFRVACGCESPRHRPFARRMHGAGIFRQHATLLARLRLLPRRAAPTELGLVQGNAERLPVGVDRDGIAVLQKRDWAADPRLGGDVANHQAVRAARKAAIGDEADLLAES